MPSWIIPLVVSLSLIGVVLITACVCLCVKYRRNLLREKRLGMHFFFFHSSPCHLFSEPLFKRKIRIRVSSALIYRRFSEVRTSRKIHTGANAMPAYTVKCVCNGKLVGAPLII